MKKHIVYEVKYISKANDNFIDITDLDEYDSEEIRDSITRNLILRIYQK